MSEEAGAVSEGERVGGMGERVVVLSSFETLSLLRLFETLCGRASRRNMHRTCDDDDDDDAVVVVVVAGECARVCVCVYGKNRGAHFRLWETGWLVGWPACWKVVGSLSIKRFA